MQNILTLEFRVLIYLNIFVEKIISKILWSNKNWYKFTGKYIYIPNYFRRNVVNNDKKLKIK